MSQVEIIVQDSNNYILEVNTQGPPGIAGDAGIGKAYVSSSAPLTGLEGELWFNDETEVLRVYANGSWQVQTMDDEFF